MTRHRSTEPLSRKRRGKLFAGRVEFLLSAPQLQVPAPEPDVPEIAFCGRSNVGKSSLVNALTGRKSIARTSVTPGRTQELNFFEIGDPTRFRLVDMPGYGFAKAPAESGRAVARHWCAPSCAGVRCCGARCCWSTRRHGLKQVDLDMMAMLDAAAVGYRLVLTKADKVNASKPWLKVLDTTSSRPRASIRPRIPQVHVTSAEKGTGHRAELRARLCWRILEA